MTCGKAIEIRGEVYPSFAAAARANGVTYHAIRLAQRAGTLDRVGLGRNSSRWISVWIDGMEFATIRLAAKILNVSRDSLEELNRSDPNVTYRVAGRNVRFRKP